MGKMNQMDYKQKEVYKLIEAHYRKNFERLVKVLGFRAGGRHNAEDIVQEAYTRALTYWNAFDMKEDFSAWFKSIQTNAMKDFYQDEIKRGIVNAHQGRDVMHDRPVALDRIKIGEFMKKMETKPKNIAKILHLSMILGYEHKEVAQQVPENLIFIKNVLQRFRKEL